MTIDENIGIDFKTFFDIQQKYKLDSVTKPMFKYLKIIEHLYAIQPHQKPLWYQEEALRRTNIYYDAHKTK